MDENFDELLGSNSYQKAIKEPNQAVNFETTPPQKWQKKLSHFLLKRKKPLQIAFFLSLAAISLIVVAIIFGAYLEFANNSF